jgi:hypothetical protein
VRASSGVVRLGWLGWDQNVPLRSFDDLPKSVVAPWQGSWKSRTQATSIMGCHPGLFNGFNSLKWLISVNKLTKV